MNLTELAGKIPGLDVRTQQLKNTIAVSITGPAKAIGIGLKLALFIGMLSIEQIARFGISKDGKSAHLVLLDNQQYELDNKDASNIPMIEGYNYAHQVTALAKKMNIGLFDAGFDPKTTTAIRNAFNRFCDAIFADGKVRGTGTNTLLLLGRSVTDRVLVAYQWDNLDSQLTAIEQAIRGDVRYASVQDTTILTVQYGTGQIAALHVDEIVNMIKNGTVPEWKTQQFARTNIEDVTPSIGDQATVVVTAKLDGKRQAVPANVRWDKKGDSRTFSMVFIKSYAADLPDDSAPIVRLTGTTVTTVNGNGMDTPEVLSIKLIDTYGEPANSAAMRRIVKDATTGQIYAAAA